MSGDSVLPLPEELQGLWAKRWFIVATVALSIVGGLGLARVVPPLYQAETALELGQVFGRSVEDPHVLVGLIGTPLLPVTGEQGLVRAYAEVVEVGVGSRVPLYIRLIGQARTGDQARRAAEQLADKVRVRHEAVFRRLTEEFRRHQEILERQTAEVDAELRAIAPRRSAAGRAKLESIPSDKEVVSKHESLVRLSQALRDARVEQALTRPTRVLMPAQTPSAPIWPQPSVFAAVSGALGLALSLAVAFVWPRVQPHIRLPSSRGAKARV